MEALTAAGFAAARRRRRGRELAGLALRRLAVAVPLLVAITLGVFVLADLSPFDPLVSYLGDHYQFTTDAQRAALTETLDLHRGWFTGWTTWVESLLHGDLGHSRSFSMPVAMVVSERLPWTLLLSGMGLAVGILLGLGGGLLAALRPGSLVDRLTQALALLAQAVPPFVLSLGAITVGALVLGWFPAGGAGPATGGGGAVTMLHHLVLPALVLAVSQTPWLLLAVRSEALDALASDPVRGAVTRGLPWGRVLRGHVLPVAVTPLISLVGVRLPELIVGAVLIEEMFAWPGLAAALVTSARALDLPLLAFLTLASAVLVLLGSLLSDVGLVLLDPRVRIDD